MPITLGIEAIVTEQARQLGLSPETLVLNSLRVMFVTKDAHRPVTPIEPQGDWERRLASIGVHTGVSLTDEQLSREVMYEDHD